MGKGRILLNLCAGSLFGLAVDDRPSPQANLTVRKSLTMICRMDDVERVGTAL